MMSLDETVPGSNWFERNKAIPHGVWKIDILKGTVLVFFHLLKPTLSLQSESKRLLKYK